MEIKTFDWEICKNTRSPKRYEWLKSNWNKPVTESEFVKAMLAIREDRIGLSRNYQPSRLKSNYKRLKRDFGFFS